MTSIAPQPGIMDIALYEGGKSKVDGARRIIKLSSNENPSGPPQSAMDAIAASTRDLHRYPSTDHLALRTAIGDVHGLSPENIICGVGSDEIITFLCQAYAGPGDEVIHTEHGFLMYRISAQAAGATPVEVSEKDRVVSVDAILSAVNERTRLVFLANPANPTGTFLEISEMERLAAGLPRNVILVLDGAYAEFVEGYDGGAGLVEARDNVVMTRTLSKLYGLGGLRVGWGYAPKAINDVLNRVRGPFNLSGPALAAGEAAIRDQDFAKKCQKENAENRAWLADELAKIGLPSDPSFANFILVRFPTNDAAIACDLHLQGQGILIRYVAGYGLPNCLRITIPDRETCEIVLAEISKFKETLS